MPVVPDTVDKTALADAYGDDVVTCDVEGANSHWNAGRTRLFAERAVPVCGSVIRDDTARFAADRALRQCVTEPDERLGAKDKSS